MPISLFDVTASSQRLQIDNSGNTELGGSTPSSPLSVQGNPVIAGSGLASSVISSGSLQRLAGSVSVPANTVATVSCPPLAGFGSCSAGGTITGFTSTSFNLANRSDTVDGTFLYAAI